MMFAGLHGEAGRPAMFGEQLAIPVVAALRMLRHARVRLLRNVDALTGLVPPHHVHDVAAVPRTQLEPELLAQLARSQRDLAARRAVIDELELQRVGLHTRYIQTHAR